LTPKNISDFQEKYRHLNQGSLSEGEGSVQLTSYY
jgi:hypothetical protein